MSHNNRIILLIDMDCFYCQVEENLNPALKGKPLAVVQYNQWRGGGIIAVNYPARDRGVTRHMRGNDARKKCPEIALVQVPEVRGKADLSKYRDAGKRVADVLQTFTPNLERASVDEAYLDITNVVEQQIKDKNDHVTAEKLPNTFVVGNATSDFIENVSKHREYDEDNLKLAIGGIVAEEIREEVFKVTGYKCSAGIAHNKILAKLVCGLHKPNKQTILPYEAVPQLFESMPIKKITGLGGKFGDNVTGKLNIQYMGQLSQFSEKELVKKFDEKSGRWLFNLAKGIDMEPVNTRLLSKSIGCCKNFTGKAALCTKEDVEHWLKELAEEIFERLEKDYEQNCRRARQMVVSFAHGNDEVSGTRTHPLGSYDPNKIFDNAFKIIRKNCLKDEGGFRITFLGISAGNFQDVKNVNEITSLFRNMTENVKKTRLNIENKQNDEYLSDDSIYSKETEESDVDVEDLIYFQQVRPESIEDQNFIVSDAKIDRDESYDSISQETDGNITSASSFFSKYFSNRNFNTSKALDNSIATQEHSSLVENHNISSSENNIINSAQKEPLSDNSCPQCGKIIDHADYQSHQDYHYTINMVKNEAHLYKSENNPPTSSSPVKGVIKKKKNLANASHKPIVDYFKANPFEDETKELCKECNKPVALNEWNLHADYHAAKKLHLEMNVNKTIAKKKPAKRGKIKGQKNLMGFFK